MATYKVQSKRKEIFIKLGFSSTNTNIFRDYFIRRYQIYFNWYKSFSTYQKEIVSKVFSSKMKFKNFSFLPFNIMRDRRFNINLFISPENIKFMWFFKVLINTISIFKQSTGNFFKMFTNITTTIFVFNISVSRFLSLPKSMIQFLFRFIITSLINKFNSFRIFSSPFLYPTIMTKIAFRVFNLFNITQYTKIHNSNYTLQKGWCQ